jgi:hypothetical protein
VAGQYQFRKLLSVVGKLKKKSISTPSKLSRLAGVMPAGEILSEPTGRAGGACAQVAAATEAHKENSQNGTRDFLSHACVTHVLCNLPDQP